MKKASALIVLLFVFCGISRCFASPSFLGACKFQQPDGTSVCFEHIMDEFGEYFMTGYGPAVLNKEGCWCYGKYDENHKLTASPYRVGDEKKNESAFNEFRNVNQKVHIKWYEMIYGKRQALHTENGVRKIATFTPRPLLVLLVQFSDTLGTYNYKSNYNDLLFSSNFSYTYDPDGNSTGGSMRDYYHSMSLGNYNLTGSVVNSDTLIQTVYKINWIDLPYRYGFCDSLINMYAFVDTVKVYASRQGVNCDSLLQSNNLAIIYAGRQKYDIGSLQSHAEASGGHGLYVVGEMSNYPYQKVFNTIGTHCHEYAHVLGDFPDDYSGSYPYGCWGLMCWGGRCTYPYHVWGGNCPAPLTPDQRYIIDPSWVNYSQITSPQSVTLTFNTTYGLSNVCELYPSHRSSGSESYFIENRQTGWDTDRVWNRGIPCVADSDGVLVWRYGSEGSNTRELIEADGVPEVTSGARAEGDAFWGGYKSYLTDFSSPSLTSLTGWESKAQISNISATGNTMTVSLGDSRFGDLPENETWSTSQSSYYIGGDFSIPSGKTLTLQGDSPSTKCTLYCSSGKKIDVKGTLSANWSKFTRLTSGTYWSGIDLDSTSVMNVNGDITIEYADCGLDINNGTTLSNGSNTITVQNCSTAGVSLNSTSIVVQNILAKNCGSYYGGIMKSGTSFNPIVWRCTANTSVHALYNQGNVTADSCTFSGHTTGDTIQLAYAAPAMYLSNNNITKRSGYYAINNRTDSFITAKNNWWGVPSLPNPPSAYFVFPDTTYIKYNPVKSDSLAYAGVYKTLGQTDPLEVAVNAELSGEPDWAISIYRELIKTETNPAWKKFLITSLLRAHDNSDKAYTDVKQIIGNELPNASGYHKAALKFILSDILAREGKYQQAVDGFIRDSESDKGTSLEVEMLARVAEIYGWNMNDPIKAKQYAEVAARLNPGQMELRNAFAAAGVEYNPAQFEDRFLDTVENFDTPSIPKKNDSQLTEFVSVSPNPANPLTTITYSIKSPSAVKLSVYAINGQKVATLVDGQVSAGKHSVKFDGSRYASGVYFYRFESAGLNKTGKMLLLK